MTWALGAAACLCILRSWRLSKRPATDAAQVAWAAAALALLLVGIAVS